MSQTQIEIQPIKTDSANEFNKQALALTDQAGKLIISNQEQYESAASLLKTVKTMASTLDEARKKITKPLDEAKQAVMNLFRNPADALVKAESDIKKTMIQYSNEQERIRQENERKIREAAKAEEDRQRKIKEKQEAELREKERIKREEADRLEKEGKAKEAEKARQQADAAAEKADIRKQEAQDVFVPAPVIASSVQKPQGISQPRIWKARITDFSKIPASQLCVSDKQKEAHLSYFNSLAKNTRDSLEIAGVEFYFETTIASR